MSKSACLDIDMDEWEVLVPDDDVALRLFSDELSLDPGEVIRMNHFTCPTQETKHHHHHDLMPVVPLGGLEKNSEDEEAAAPPPPPPPRVFIGDIGVIFTGQEVVSVSEEFPKLDTRNQELSIPHYYCYPETTPYKYKFEESPKSGDFLGMMESPKSPSTNIEKEGEEGEEEEYAYALAEGKEHKEAAAACPGANIWGWRVSGGGFGTLCSIGVAAATVCIFILGGRQQQQHHHHHQNQRLQFQIYADDKRMKQVMQQATRLNQALSVVRGVPMTRAHISFGGYYDGGL